MKNWNKKKNEKKKKKHEEKKEKEKKRMIKKKNCENNENDTNITNKKIGCNNSRGRSWKWCCILWIKAYETDKKKIMKKRK